jgi:SAM-dependent methyltransferase
MRLLYGRHYAARTWAVADQVPDGASVLECCCGPGALYLRHLRGRIGAYVGIDVNPRFVARLRRRGVDARQLDLAAADVELPRADVVILQASLYHFLPHAERIVEKMLGAAGQRVIVSEPVRNLASSRVPLLARLGARATDPSVGEHAQRFTEASLAALMERYRERLLKAFPIPGGREMVYVLGAASADRSRTAGGP